MTWTSSRNFLDKPISQLTGLVQLGVRAYDATIGRFLSVDPVLDPANPQQNSPYNYGWNNPVTSSDPTGMIPDDYAGTNTVPPHTNSSGGGGTGGTSKPPHAAGNNRSATKSQPDKPKQEWWNPFSWNGDTWQTIGAVAAGTALAVGAAVALAACIAATVGICAGVVGGIAVGVAAGAAIGAASSAVTYGLEPGEKTAEGWLLSVGVGAGLGAVTAGIGPLFASAASSVVKAGTIAATQEAVEAGIQQTASAAVRDGGESVAAQIGSDLFRGDTRGMTEIFEEGFKPVGTDMDLLAHAAGESAGGSGYVATSQLRSVAADFGPNIYTIRAPGGINVNQVLGAASPYKSEMEVAFPGGIPNTCIVGCSVGGKFFPNPNFGG